jgi:predicted  nucleic acid-binding Zn-ribbon protein
MSSSSPNSGSTVLRTLHRLQRQLTDLTDRLSRGPKQIQATEANVKRCEDELEKTKAEAKSLRMMADQKQLQLRTQEDKAKDLQTKLNTATNNREYQAFREQIAAAKMARSVLEDEILEAMEKADGFQKNIAEAEAVVVAAKKRSAEVQAKVAEEQQPLRADVERITAELRETESALPEDIQETYNRIVRQKGEDALATVEDQYCRGCNQQIQLNMLNKVMLGQPVFCKSCGRLLYMPE